MDVVQETLQVMVERGGANGLDAVQRYCPTYDYCHPTD